MVPEQHWEGVPVTATLGRAGVDPVACFLKVYAGNFAVLLPLRGNPGPHTAWDPTHTGAWGAVTSRGARSGVC